MEKSMNNLQQEIIIKELTEFKDQYFAKAISWGKADADKWWKTQVTVALEAVRQQAYGEGLEYGMTSKADEYRKGYNDAFKEKKR